MQGINKYWKEGKYIDLWSVNHLLSGVVLAAILYHFHIEFSTALIISLALFVGWEILEKLIGINEHFSNICMDVICDTAGFLMTSYFYLVLSRPFTITTSIIFALLFTTFNIWGYSAYEKRSKLE